MVSAPEGQDQAVQGAHAHHVNGNGVRAWIGWLLHPGPRLSQRVVHAGVWALALRMVERSFGFVRTIILARLLAPEDFGLMGIALLMLSLLEAFTQTGFSAALIQKKGDIKPYLDTAWTIDLIRQAAAAALLFLAAPFVARFFDAPAAANIVRVIAATVLVSGFINIGVIYFQKELEFHKQFIYQFSATVADFGVALVAAILLRNAWALVLGVLAGNLVGLMVSYVVHPYRPGLAIDWQKGRELFGFGKWVFSSNLLNYLVHNVDSLVVGKVLNTTALGLYQMAFRLSNAAATEITNVVSQVAFPTYSKIQDDTPRLREAALRTMSMVATVSLPLAGGVFILAPDLTMLLLGEKWMPMVPVLQLLCISGALRSVTANFGSIFLGAGRPDIQTKASLMDLAILGIGLYPLVTTFAMMGAVYARLLTFASQFYVWPRFARLLQAGFMELVRTLAAPLLCTIVMVVAVAAWKAALRPQGIMSLLLVIAAGGACYLGALVLLDSRFELGILRSLRQMRTALR